MRRNLRSTWRHFGIFSGGFGSPSLCSQRTRTSRAARSLRAMPSDASRRVRVVVVALALLACAPAAASALQKPNLSSPGGPRHLLQSPSATRGPTVAADTVGVDAIVDGRDVVLPVTLATCDAGVRECDNRKFLKTLATHQNSSTPPARISASTPLPRPRAPTTTGATRNPGA